MRRHGRKQRLQGVRVDPRAALEGHVVKVKVGARGAQQQVEEFVLLLAVHRQEGRLRARLETPPRTRAGGRGWSLGRAP